MRVRLRLLLGLLGIFGVGGPEKLGVLLSVFEAVAVGVLKPVRAELLVHEV